MTGAFRGSCGGGHRIPAWHCDACHEIVVARETPTVCPTCGGNELRQETDVLDMWVSSGLLPFTVFGWDGNGSVDAGPGGVLSDGSAGDGV